MAGLTLDSGALIAFERGERRVVLHFAEAQRRGRGITVPTVVVAEVWRGGPRSARVASLLSSCIVEPLEVDLARSAGAAVAAITGAGIIDAIVMASAAMRGDYVLTSDFDDLDRLKLYFPSVRLLRV
ncbi:MAG: PIN domain-containing protein [Deltaproteobacteria bacterium]|nr:PIN domain-containing protein [Deltaproteobacteria bacterium]